MNRAAFWLSLLVLSGCAAKPEPKPKAPPAGSAAIQAATLAPADVNEVIGSPWVGEARPTRGQAALGLAQSTLSMTFLDFNGADYEIRTIDGAGKPQLVARGTWVTEGREFVLTPGPGTQPLSVYNYALDKNLRFEKVGDALRAVGPKTSDTEPTGVETWFVKVKSG